MQAIVQAYWDMPPVTRTYMTAICITTMAVQLDFVTPFHLYFNWGLIAREYQVWRLLTSFCYFGSIGFTFLFNIVFTYRHCQALEEGWFRGKTADFVFMFMLGWIFMIGAACFVHMIFLGHAFTIMLVYIWSRRNPFVIMNFFGILSFSAPYLPWVLLLFSLLLGQNAMVDVFGICAGHLYYFLEDVFPRQPNGFRVLETPSLLKRIFDMPSPAIHVNVDDRPGGLNWGTDENAAGDNAQAVPTNNERPANEEVNPDAQQEDG